MKKELKNMKLYNIFKPHVVEFSNGKFAVRKLTSIGFRYLDTDTNHWWLLHEHVSKYALMSSLGEANKLKESLIIKKHKVITVHG